jgi:hypothetical protein
MFKKLLFIGTLFMFILVQLPTDAKAGKSRTIIGWPTTSGSLHVTVMGEGPGNYDKWPGKLKMWVWPRYVSLLCENPTGKKWPVRQGTPYFFEGEVTQEQPSATWPEIGNNGDFAVPFYFSNSDLFGEEFDGCPDDACDTNPHWDCARDIDGNVEPLLIEFDARIVLESNPTGTEGGYITDHDVGVHCTLNDDLVNYTCVDDCDDLDENFDPVCFNYDYQWSDNIAPVF